MVNPEVQFVRETLGAAGTILISPSAAYFELSNKSPNFIRDLQSAVNLLAIKSGAKMREGNPHPVTQSSATVSIDIDTSETNPFRDLAKKVRAGLFETNNVFAYNVQAPQPSFMRAANISDTLAQAEFLQHCHRIYCESANGNKPARGVTLHRIIEDAVALNANVPQQFFAETLTVPITLYNRDPIKEHAVRVYMARLAAQYGGKYTTEVIGTGPQRQGVYAHVLRGEKAVAAVEARIVNPDIINNESWVTGVLRDVARSSLDHNFTGNILANARRSPHVAASAIQQDGTFLGINLFGGAPR